MSGYNWQDLLREFSFKLIERRDEYDTWELPPDKVKSGWLGNTGASEEQLVLAETRLGRKLPPSYREFLKVSNGWPISDWTDFQLWSTENIEWFSKRNPDFNWPPDTDERPSVPDEYYYVYGQDQDCINLRLEYLEKALEISSDSGEGEIFLLIPDVIFDDGEWEAWLLGAKLPGAARYRSFYELMLEVIEKGDFIVQ